MWPEIKAQLGTPGPHIGCLRFKSQLCSWCQFPANVHPGRQEVMAQAGRDGSSSWFFATHLRDTDGVPGSWRPSGLVPVVHTWRMKQWMEISLSLSFSLSSLLPSLFLSVCLSAIQRDRRRSHIISQSKSLYQHDGFSCVREITLFPRLYWIFVNLCPNSCTNVTIVYYPHALFLQVYL